jgi:hypothetical protein
MLKMGKKDSKVRSEQREPINVSQNRHGSNEKTESLNRLKNQLYQAQLDGNTKLYKLLKIIIERISNTK